MTDLLLILAPLIAGPLGFIAGWIQANRFAQSHSEYRYVEITPEEAEAFIDAFLLSRAQHPSNRFRHPEMEEEDDC